MKPMKSLRDYLNDPIKISAEILGVNAELEVLVDHEFGDKVKLREVKLEGVEILDTLSEKGIEHIRQQVVHHILQYTYDLADYREAVKEARHDFQRDA
jgi:hypothetical protein